MQRTKLVVLIGMPDHWKQIFLSTILTVQYEFLFVCKLQYGILINKMPTLKLNLLLRLKHWLQRAGIMISTTECMYSHKIIANNVSNMISFNFF